MSIKKRSHKEGRDLIRAELKGKGRNRYCAGTCRICFISYDVGDLSSNASARALAVGVRLFAVVGASLPQEALLVTRTEEQKWTSVGLFETAIDALVNAPRPEPFQF